MLCTFTSTWYLNTSITAEQNLLLIKQVLLCRPLLQVFTFRSLLPLEFILLCGVSLGSNFVLPHVHISCLSTICWRWFSSPLMDLVPLSKTNWAYNWGAEWRLPCIPLFSASVFCTGSAGVLQRAQSSPGLYILIPLKIFVNPPPSHSPHPLRVTSPIPILYIHITPIFISPAQKAFWNCITTWPDACWSSLPGDLTNLTHINLNSFNTDQAILIWTHLNSTNFLPIPVSVSENSTANLPIALVWNQAIILSNFLSPVSKLLLYAVDFINLLTPTAIILILAMTICCLNYSLPLRLHI